MANALAGYSNKCIIPFSIMCTTCSYSPRKRSWRIFKSIYQESGSTTQHSDSAIAHSDNSALHANPPSNNLAVNNLPDANDVFWQPRIPLGFLNLCQLVYHPLYITANPDTVFCYPVINISSSTSYQRSHDEFIEFSSLLSKAMFPSSWESETNRSLTVQFAITHLMA